MIIEKWQIWLCNLDPIVGSEQGKTRPVLIISENYTHEVLNIANVLPITSRKNNRTIYPNEVLIKANNFGLQYESIILVYQIRTIDKRRLINLYGTVNDNSIKTDIEEALKFQLGL